MGMMSIEMCVTLQDYLSNVLKRTQWQIAGQAGVSQTYVSMVVTGKRVPTARSIKFQPLLEALQLTARVDDFFRMVRNASKLRALKKPMADEYPLFAAARMDGRGMVVDLMDAVRMTKQA